MRLGNEMGDRGRIGAADGPTDEEEDGELAGSRLGRKEHWDQVYAEELANLEEHGDEGELWCALLYPSPLTAVAVQYMARSGSHPTCSHLVCRIA